MTRRVPRVGWWAALAFAVIAANASTDAPPHAPPPGFSIIDIHTHLGGVGRWPGKRPNFEEIVRTMNEMRVELVVDFKAPDHSLEDGVFGARVSQRLGLYPDTARFKLFANIPIDDAGNVFLGSRRADYPTWVAGILEDAVARGAAGLKIKYQAVANNGVADWTRDTSGDLVPFDSPAFDPLWSTAERLGIPVLVHLGGAYKGEHQPPRGPNRGVRWEMLMLERERVLRKHPRLRMIAAHWAGTAGDRPYLEEVLERYPNLFTEGGADQPKVPFTQLDSAEGAFFERYQDQVMFGTDYMESTFGWLKSYRQRLDMFLPFTEHWPLPDSVLAKYYHGNARRLLRRRDANERPMAHPGFTTTRLVGDTVALDGTASYGAPRGALRYQWRQILGPRVRLAGDTAASPRFVAGADGDYAFELTVRDDSATSRPRSTRVNVLPPGEAFVENEGRVTIEAEHFASTAARGGQAWAVARDQPGFSGDGYVVAGPRRETAIEPGDFAGRAPALRYVVWIQHPGTYAVYARGMASDTARAYVHVGLDNEEARLADHVGRFPPGRWAWARDAFEWDAQFQMTDTTLAVLNMADAGPHIVNVWMYRDGVKLDRLMLVRAPFAEVSRPLFDPGTSVGPAESPRRRLTR